VIAEENDGWNDLRIEVDTDDCDSKNAKDMMNEVIRRCNAANEEYMSTETEQLPLEIQLAQAREEIAELRRDKARLDWLADASNCYFWVFRTQPHGCKFEFGEPYLDIRDAIESAIEEGKK
jgi:hypothetical protein